MRHTKTAHRVLSSYCSSNIPQSQKVCWKSNESRSSTLVKTFSEQQRILDKSEFSHASHTLTISAFGHVTQWLLFRLDSTERKRRRLYWWSVTFLRRSGFSAAPQRFFVKFVNDSSLGARGDAVQQLVGVEQSLEWWKIAKKSSFMSITRNCDFYSSVYITLPAPFLFVLFIDVQISTEVSVRLRFETKPARFILENRYSTGWATGGCVYHTNGHCQIY